MDNVTGLIFNIAGITCSSPLMALAARDESYGRAVFWGGCLLVCLGGAAINIASLA